MAKIQHVDFVAYGICTLSVVPVRIKPDMKTEIVTQLLFGECFKVISERKKQWYKIESVYDNYIGWIDSKQCSLITYGELEKMTSNYAVSLELCQPAFSNEHAINIVFGSQLPNYDGICFNFPQATYNFSGQAIYPGEINLTAEFIEKIARKFLFAPHLYGGKSPFGVDSSGFIQIIFKVFGVHLPRDSADQIYFGEAVDFVEQSRVGDLAFFHNKDGLINHVGMILPGNRIIHSYGHVRIDRYDHQGIYSKNRRKYSHRLRIIKRVIQELEL